MGLARALIWDHRPRTGFRDGDDDYTRAIYQKVLETDPATPEHKAAWAKYYRDIEAALEENAELVRKGLPASAIPTQTPGNMRGNRDALLETHQFSQHLGPGNHRDTGTTSGLHLRVVIVHGAGDDDHVGAVIDDMPGLMHALFDRDDEVVGHVLESGDSAHVVYRTTAMAYAQYSGRGF